MPNYSIPPGYHTITPYFTVENAQAFIDFVVRALEGEVTEKMTAPDGQIMHAEMRIGTSPLMIGQARGEWTPQPMQLYLYVSDVDAWYERALAAGATVVRPLQDQFYGDRSGGVKDPFGNTWWLASRIENVSPEEMQKRALGPDK